MCVREKERQKGKKEEGIEIEGEREIEGQREREGIMKTGVFYYDECECVCDDTYRKIIYQGTILGCLCC